MQIPKIALHHPGARRGYATTLALKLSGLLYKTFTDFYADTGFQYGAKILDKATQDKFKVYQKLGSRWHPDILDVSVEHLGVKGVFLNFLRNHAPSYIDSLKLDLKIADAIAQHMGKEGKNFDYIYCMALSAISCRTYAPSKPVFLDQIHIPISTLLPIIEKEIASYSDWVIDDNNPYKGGEEFLINYENMDWQAADFIITPSEFIKIKVAEQLNDNFNRISCIPYAVPAWLYRYNNSLTSLAEIPGLKFPTDKLRILFVGQLGLRKGIHYLLQALKKIDKNKFEMRAIGSPNIPLAKIREYSDICTFLGKLNKEDLVAQYEWANIFVLPSLGEGSAGVINEALAFGLPVITTFSSGSNVRDGVEGYIVPEGNIDALCDRINEYINDYNKVSLHSKNAWNRAKEFTLEKSAQRLMQYFFDLKL